MLRRKIISALVIHAVLLPAALFAQTQSIYEVPKDVFEKIKEEGTKNSQVMKTLSYMTDVIGPRLTGSPGMKRANDWTRDTLASWGLQNAHLESWGPFGRGWTLKKFYANVDGPTAFPLIAYPKAWSPGTDTLIPKPVFDPKAKKSKLLVVPPYLITAFTGEVVTFNAQNEAELEKYKGKLKGKIVLVGAMRELKAEFEPQGSRRNEANLLELANAPDPNAPRTAGATPPPAVGNQQQFQFASRRLRFLHEEGAAVLIDVAFKGDGGTIFVSGAQAVQPAAPTPGQPPMNVRTKGAIVPIQLTTTPEHFNRLGRTIDAGEKPTMTVDLAVEFQDTDPNAYNTIAEIPGSDKADEIVMLGGHLDSWHAGTGATDNGSGCAVMMEAVRIIQTLGLKPRRTIRIALWSGEEQGLLGSRAYVRQHFGYRGDGTTPQFGGGGGGGQGAAQLPLTKLADYDKFSAYYNIDNGTGKIRGVYMQGNEGVRPIFRRWIAPFRDMGATTLTLANTGGTDHLAFDAIGLPGFQFIQDEVEYSTRTHHSNMDGFDRIQADDMKQMSIVLAMFVYQTAMMDEKIPRKPMR